VRFDAECVLIPDLGAGAGSKRPRMVTKSYSLPLWKKSSKEEDVVLKVALPRWVIHRWLLFIFISLYFVSFSGFFLALYFSPNPQRRPSGLIRRWWDGTIETVPAIRICVSSATAWGYPFPPVLSHHAVCLCWHRFAGQA
jgi:hypothetical protein